MMVWPALLTVKPAAAVKEILPAGNVLTVLVGVYCDARHVWSPPMPPILSIALRYTIFLVLKQFSDESFLGMEWILFSEIISSSCRPSHSTWP